MTAVADRIDTTLPAWLVALRQQGGQRFAELGLPKSKDEEWRFTPISPISSTTFGVAPEATVSLDALAPFMFGHAEWPRLVFVNGRYSADLSSVSVESGVRVESLAQVRSGNAAAREAPGPARGDRCDAVRGLEHRADHRWRVRACAGAGRPGAADPPALRDGTGCR